MADTLVHPGASLPVSPPLPAKIAALREALRRLDGLPPFGLVAKDARVELLKAAQAAGFDPVRCVEDWARYTVAVAEVTPEETDTDDEQGALAL